MIWTPNRKIFIPNRQGGFIGQRIANFGAFTRPAAAGGDFPVVENQAEYDSEANFFSSHDLPWPDGNGAIVAGETILSFFVIDGGGQDRTPITYPTNWITADHAFGNNVTSAVSYFKATGGETGTFVVTNGVGGERALAITYRISGAADPGVTGPTLALLDGGTTVHPCPNLVSGFGIVKALWFAMILFDDNSGDSVVTLFPTDFVNTGDVTRVGNDVSIGFANKNDEVASLKPDDYNITLAHNGTTYTVAVAPA